MPEAPVSPVVKSAEFDKISTYIGDKKRIYLITLVDRETRCFLGWKAAWERSQELVQAIVDYAPKAEWYYSDAFNVYASILYHWVRYAFLEGKTDIYSMECNHAKLRHYLARLARSSRCFSCYPYALHCAVRLFVYYFNQRLLRKHLFPKYSFHITDFVHSPF